MIDKRHTDLCAVLLSTGQLNVIHLPSGNTLYHKWVACWNHQHGLDLYFHPRHLEFDGQLKLALHQPRFSGTQRIAVKFRNFVNFYDLNLSSVQSEISLKHIRTLRITRWYSYRSNCIERLTLLAWNNNLLSWTSNPSVDKIQNTKYKIQNTKNFLS